MKAIRRIGVWLALGLAVVSLAACGGSTPTAPPPAGAASGQNTFLYFFTDP